MPIYEYQCSGCGQMTEALQKFSDKPLRKCPNCGGKLSKLMSMNSFQLKGEGWYLTDYAKKDAPPVNPEAHKNEPKADKGDKAAKAPKKEAAPKKAQAAE